MTDKPNGANKTNRTDRANMSNKTNRANKGKCESPLFALSIVSYSIIVG